VNLDQVCADIFSCHSVSLATLHEVISVAIVALLLWEPVVWVIL